SARFPLPSRLNGRSLLPGRREVGEGEDVSMSWNDPSVKDEWMAKNQKIFGPKIVDGALNMQLAIEEQVAAVASRIPGARRLTPPDTDEHGFPKLRIKDPAEAFKKVQNEYGGAWVD